MGERKFPLQPVGVDYVCDVCQLGLMLESGKPNWSEEPIKFPHKCSNCGTEMKLSEKYPTVRFERASV